MAAVTVLATKALDRARTATAFVRGLDAIEVRFAPHSLNHFIRSPKSNTMSAYFTFQQASPKGELKTFVFRLDDERKIAEARAILNDLANTKRQVQGTIVPSPVPYNPGWSFHLDPASIGFFELQMEVCDSNVTYVEEHLDEIGGAFLPNSFWCPWSSKLAAEVTDSSAPC